MLNRDFPRNLENGHVRQGSEIQSEMIVKYRAPAITGLLGKGKTTMRFVKNKGVARIQLNYAVWNRLDQRHKQEGYILCD